MQKISWSRRAQFQQSVLLSNAHSANNYICTFIFFTAARRNNTKWAIVLHRKVYEFLFALRRTPLNVPFLLVYNVPQLFSTREIANAAPLFTRYPRGVIARIDLTARACDEIALNLFHGLPESVTQLFVLFGRTAERQGRQNCGAL